MSESAIRTEIYNILSSVPDIGKVYDYDRWAADWPAFINLFKTTIAGKEQIRGFEIVRISALAAYDDNAEETTTHQYRIRGYMSLKDADATEKTFNSLIESIRDKFRFNFALNGKCEFAGPVSVDVIDIRTFGSVLCHYCELSLPVQELYTA